MTGHAISFATHDQRRDVKQIEKLIRKSLPVATLPKLERVASITPPRGDRPDPRARGARGAQDSRSRDPRSRGPRDSRDSRSMSSRPPGARPTSGRPAGSGPSSRPPSRGAATGKTGNKRKKWSDYERGRKAPPQSLKKISPNTNGFFISRKSYADEE